VSPAPIEDRRLTGILCVLVALVLFTGIDSCAKWLVLSGMPPMVVVFTRYAVHALLVAAMFLPLRRGSLLTTQRPGLEIVRALALLTSTVCNFIAVQYLPLTLTAAIFFTAPLWICVLSIPLLGEKVGIRRWAAIVVGLTGGFIATRPWSADFHWAVFVSLGTPIASAFYNILTRQLAGVDSTSTQQFYAGWIATLAIAPVAAIDWQWPTGTLNWVLFALIGAFGWAGHQFLTVAHRFAPASALAPFLYLQMVFLTAASWIIFHQPPDRWTLAGASIVLASGLYVWLRERHLARVGKTRLSGGEATGVAADRGDETA
jgi:drug/metabolite transporter (DMT)-like permease